jgi:hypothetical protein
MLRVIFDGRAPARKSSFVATREIDGRRESARDDDATAGLRARVAVSYGRRSLTSLP